MDKILEEGIFEAGGPIVLSREVIPEPLLPLPDELADHVNTTLRNITPIENNVRIVGIAKSRTKIGFAVNGILVTCFGSRGDFESSTEIARIGQDAVFAFRATLPNDRKVPF